MAMPTIRCRTFRWEPLMFFQIVHPLVEILPVRIFYFWSAHVAAAIGHCHMGTSKPKNAHWIKMLCRYTRFFKNVFPLSPSTKWKRSSTRARDQKYQLKPKCGHTCCVHTWCRVVDNPVTRFKFFFQHEINHSLLLFRRTHFLKHRAVTLTLLRRIWRPLRHIIVGSAYVMIFYYNAQLAL